MASEVNGIDALLGYNCKVQETEPNRERLIKILQHFNSPKILCDFYRRLKPEQKIEYVMRSENGVDEIFQFHTIDETVKFYDKLTDEQMSAMQKYDIGYHYMGMGHICTLVFDKRNGKYYFRHDGGSNGWEVESVNKFFDTKFDPDDAIYRPYMFNFNDAINKILTTDISKVMIMESTAFDDS